MDTRVSNPLLEPWDTPFGLPPFERIAPEHYEPAFAAAMQEHLAELRNISTSTAAPDFDNTIVAFEHSGRTLRRIAPLSIRLRCAFWCAQLRSSPSPKLPTPSTLPRTRGRVSCN